MLLREQMKQIRKELGEEGDRDDVEELRDRIAKLELSETARNEVERELRRLDRTAPQAAEYQVIRTYLEWITELPWSARTDDKIDLHRAEEILDEDHYGLEDVKDRVLEFLAVRKLQQERFAEDEADGADSDREADSEVEAGAATEAEGGEVGDEGAAAGDGGRNVDHVALRIGWGRG